MYLLDEGRSAGRGHLSLPDLPTVTPRLPGARPDRERVPHGCPPNLSQSPSCRCHYRKSCCCCHHRRMKNRNDLLAEP